MATIQNDRDVLLQAAAVRVVPVTIAITDVVGLPAALAAAEKSLEITASTPYFSGAAGAATSPTTITLTAVRKNDLAGTVSWVVEAGAATLVPSGGTNNTCSITGSTVSGASVTVRARVNDNGRNYDARITIGKYGALTMQNSVDLTTQVTGQLNSGKVTGLGALALLNTVNLNTQTVGALNGATQVTNLGSLAYANAIAANQIGAGTLAAGVIYSGTINAEKINGGNFTGKTFTGGRFVGTSFATAESGDRAEILTTGADAHTITVTGSNGLTAIQAGRIITNSASNIGPSADINSSTNSAMWLGCNSNTPHIVLKAIPTKPSSVGWAGGIAYSSLHGFIFCNGENWYKPAGWTVV